MSTSSAKCPPPPKGKELQDRTNKILNSMGASQKCISNFNMATKQAVSTQTGLAAGGGMGIMGGGFFNNTNVTNEMNQSQYAKGCGSVFANVLTQLNSQQNILCTLNDAKNTTEISGSARSTIKITTVPPTPAQLKANQAAIAALAAQRPEQPIIPPGIPTAVSIALINAYRESLRLYNQRIALFGPPALNIRNTTIRNRATANFRVVASTDNVTTTKLVEEAKTVAKASAMSELKQKTGVGGKNPQVRALVDQQINNKNQSITNSINSTLNSVKVNQTASNQITISAASGPLNLDGVTIDQYAQSRIVTKNIMTIATDMGKEVANQIISSSSQSSSTDQTAKGAEDVLKQIFTGLTDVTKASQSSFGALTSFLTGGALIFGVVAIVFLMFGPKVIGGVTNAVAGGNPYIKALISLIIIYFAVAWFVGWWPFNKKKKSEDKPKDSDKKPKDSDKKPKDSDKKPKDSDKKPKDSDKKPKDSVQKPKGSGKKKKKSTVN